MGNSNKTAIITGGAQGIGRIITDSLLKDGWKVAVFDIDGEALAEEAQRLEKQDLWTGFLCDITREEEVLSAVESAVGPEGRIDLLVNNAAIHANKPLAELEISAFRRVIDVNLTGALICAKACAKFLQTSKGSIINISSTRAFQSEANTEAYSASKGGIYALTHALAVSLGPDIRVNCISPGWIDVSAVRKSANSRQEELSVADHHQHPAGRVGNGYDIARMVKFLADPDNSFITGQNFFVDGGMSKKMIYV
jgi:NAD(P)-dependent dehydrogenase (short-subunit alcohol dehydrogenase family)